MRARVILALLGAALLALPTALAHLEFARPSLQAGEPPRAVQMTLQGTAAEVALTDSFDPLRNWVLHDVDPAKGLVRAEHRRDPPRAEEAFVARAELARLVEYRDLNADGRFSTGVDTALRSWRFSSQPWKATPVQNATVGGARGKAVTWTSNLTGAPSFEMTLAAAGLEVTDEGARARPQDVLLYLDALEVPPRGVGALHVLEGAVTAPEGSVLREVDTPDNETVGFYVEGDGRRYYFLWGGQGAVDGREQPLGFTHGEPTVGDGNATWEFRLHLPTMDRSLHLVVVSGIEYAPSTARTPGPAAWAILAAAGAALLLVRVGRKVG